MDSGYYAAFTGLMARMQALDLVANNLANANTTGFRGQHEFYRAVTASVGDLAMSPLNTAINDYGVLGGTNIDLRQGSLQATGNGLDLAVRGTGFFVVQTGRGVRYTRNGSFHVSAAGQIVTEDGDPILGPQGPIQVPQGAVSVASDGTVSVAGVIAGGVRLAEFAPGTDLSPEGNSNFIAPAGSERVATKSAIEPGMLEASNLTPIEETVTLMVLQRHSELLERTLSIFLNDFNRTAVLELARRLKSPTGARNMFRSLYTAASGMEAQELSLDNIANNLANANTSGFRRRRLQFQDLLYQSIVTPGAPSTQQTIIPSGLQVGLGSRASRNRDYSAAGELQCHGESARPGDPGRRVFPDSAAER